VRLLAILRFYHICDMYFLWIVLFVALALSSCCEDFMYLTFYLCSCGTPDYSSSQKRGLVLHSGNIMSYGLLICYFS
jgi:hypothetical protein